MGNPLKDRAPPAELARSGQAIDIEEDLSNFERLVGIVEEDLRTHLAEEAAGNWRQSPVAIRLRFEWADDRREYPAVEGSVTANVPVVCQRCLEPFVLTLSTPLKLLFADSEGRIEAGEQYEVWELDEAAVSPLDIVEEVLIMAMPLVASHGSGTKCGAGDKPEGPGGADTIRPFAELKSLMHDKE